LSLRSTTTVSNSNIPPSSPTTHLELTSALMRSYVVFISRRAMNIQNFHKNWLLRYPRRRPMKPSGRMESFRHCLCTVLCRDFALPVDARLQPNSERFRCMATARAEYTRIVNHQRVQRLLRTRVPPAADRQLHVGQNVFVWLEKERKYCGPLPYFICLSTVHK
jgi:hypothetical protein